MVRASPLQSSDFRLRSSVFQLKTKTMLINKSNPLLVIFKRELDWMIKHKEYWFLTLLGPLLGFMLVLGIFHKGVVRELHVSLVDNDNTKMSRQAANMIDATSIADLETVANLHDANELMLEGKTNAIIYIEKGFEKNLLRVSQSDIVVYLNSANILKGGLLKAGILKTLATFNAGVKVQIAMKKGLNYTQAVDAFVPIQVDKHVLFNPYTNYFYFLATILMPVILILFTLIGSIYSLGNELKNGTAGAALRKANNSIIVLTVGKLLPYTILFFLQALIFNYVIFVLMDVPLTGSYTLILVSELLLIVSYQALAIFLIGTLGNMRLSASLGSAYSMMALTFAGLTFPDFGMPVIAQLFGRIFPLTYWLKVFLGQTLRYETLEVSMPYILYLFVFIIVGAISMFWLKQKYVNEKYWNKV